MRWHMSCSRRNTLFPLVKRWKNRTRSPGSILTTLLTPPYYGQIQIGIHLARRLSAHGEPSQQDADQGIQQLSKARRTAQLGLRRQLDATSGGEEFGLCAETGRCIS